MVFVGKQLIVYNILNTKLHKIMQKTLFIGVLPNNLREVDAQM